MDLDLNPDQSMLLTGIAPLLARYRRLPDPAKPIYYAYGEAFEQELEEGGFYGEPGATLPANDAGLLLGQIAESPYAVASMAALMVAPLASVKLPRPVALLSSMQAGPVRFLEQARTALIHTESRILYLDLTETSVVPVHSIFAYPYAKLEKPEGVRTEMLAEVDPARFLDRWRLGLTYEILGAMRASLALTLDYVKQREQFKRTIGSFQAVQHRLAEDATRVEAIHDLAARAAWSESPADIALAASYAQQAVPQLVYDCHQFHGAMGLTLEYVLHHWTYRLKALAGELGGAGAQGRRATIALWDTAA